MDVQEYGMNLWADSLEKDAVKSFSELTCKKIVDCRLEERRKKYTIFLDTKKKNCKINVSRLTFKKFSKMLKKSGNKSLLIKSFFSNLSWKKKKWYRSVP